MSKTSHKSAAAAYATALLELANEQKQAEPIRQELRDLSRLVSENSAFGAFVSSPAITATERGQMIQRILGGQLSPLMSNFIGVLNQKNRVGELAQIAAAYNKLLDVQQGKIDVELTVAAELPPRQLEQVRRQVSSALKKDAVVKQRVDDSIIAGVMLRVHDKLIDGSVKTQLATIKQQLLAAKPR